MEEDSQKSKHLRLRDFIKDRKKNLACRQKYLHTKYFPKKSAKIFVSVNLMLR